MHTCNARARTLALVPILAIALALAAGTAFAADFWVDANAGDDTNPGTELLPFATLTYAVGAGGVGAIIYVLPGIYDAAHGETFPITLLASQQLIGDPATKGAGSEPTVIDGRGSYAGFSDAYFATVVCGPDSEVAGVQFDSDIGESFPTNHAAVVIHGGTAKVHDNRILSGPETGVRMNDAHTSQIRNNVFENVYAGVWLEACPDVPVIEGNVFAELAVGIEVVSSNPWIHDNVFEGAVLHSVAVWSGAPRIEGNTLEAGSGSIVIGFPVMIGASMPVVRSNAFFNSLGILIEWDGNPDLGTESDRGRNDFRGIDGVCIQHDGSAAVWAVGNSWPNDPPIMGVDIIIDGDGSVILGSVPVRHPSVGRLKARF